MERALNDLTKEELIAHISEQNAALKTINSSLQDTIVSLETKTVHLETKAASLEAKTVQQQEEIACLKYQVDLLRRMQFGQKRERFEGDPAQGLLPFETPAEEEAQQLEQVKEQITYTRTKQSAHKGRAALPEHLPVEEIEIHPDGDLSDMVCIGKDITEELDCEPARFFIRRYIRYKYAPKNGEGVKTGALPERVIDKGIPGAGLLAMILTDKYLDHRVL